MLDKDMINGRAAGPADSSSSRNGPQNGSERRQQNLREAYGLTPAEERLAWLIFQGLRLDQAEAALGIRHSTARTHMKRIYAKTGTHRQVELVRLLITGQPVELPEFEKNDEE